MSPPRLLCEVLYESTRTAVAEHTDIEPDIDDQHTDADMTGPQVPDQFATSTRIVDAMAAPQPRPRPRTIGLADVDLADMELELPYRHKLDVATYDEELHALQVELGKLHRWVQEQGERVVILFEGRDAAGKGGTIHGSRHG